jgi:hypothetical protein
MPIETSALYRRFLQVKHDTTVGELLEKFRTLPAEARDQSYVIVRLEGPGPQVVASACGGFTLGDGRPGYSVLPPDRGFADSEAVEMADQLDVSLGSLPGLPPPARMVERTIMGEGRARRDWLPRSPGRRLVVLESNIVIGLLVDEERAGAFGGIMTQLFGQDQVRTSLTKGRQTYRCPRCPPGENIYDLTDLIDLSTDVLICPRGHKISE